MAKTLTDMLTGMSAAFLANAPLTAEIEQRLWELGDPLMIATFESIATEPAASHGKFATYRDAGELVDRLTAGKESKLRRARVEFDCYGKYPPDARSLRELVLAVVGEGYAGTWGSSPAVTIKNAHWEPASQEMDYDETLKMSRARAVLIVPYLNN